MAASAFAAISLHPCPSLLSKPSSFVGRRRLPPFLLLASSSPSDFEFNISFSSSSSSSKTLIPDHTASTSSSASEAAAPLPVLIPWIVRGEDGNLCLRTSPPPHILRAMAQEQEDTKNSKKQLLRNKKKGDDATSAAAAKTKAKDKKAPEPALTAPPKYSKAARRFYNENVREPQRLAKVLAAAGVASRRSSEELIFQGNVTVNGSICTSPQTRVDISKDSVYVNGNRLSKKLPPKLYFALNKPKGYICSCGEESKSAISLFDDYLKRWTKMQPGIPKPRLFTVGRLDVATTGLIIVTNDGEFAQRLAHPSSKLSKEYIATVDGTVHRRHLIAISEGTEIDGIKCIPDSVELLPSQPDATKPRLRIVVHEGRNHEVRELVNNAGLQVYSLKRVRIGRFRLPSDLGIGKFVELKAADIKSLERNLRS